MQGGSAIIPILLDAIRTEAKVNNLYPEMLPYEATALSFTSMNVG
jgi:hypothetical protein